MKSKVSKDMLKTALFAALVSTAMPEMATAAGNIGATLDAVKTNELSKIPDFIAAIAYVLGAVLMLSGALSLKKHAESPATEPMAKGIGRLAVGGAVIALPALADVMTTSTHLGTGPAQFQAFGKQF